MLERHIPAGCIYDQFNSAKVETLCSTQRAAAKKGKLRNVCVILDDMVSRTTEHTTDHSVVIPWRPCGATGGG